MHTARWEAACVTLTGLDRALRLLNFRHRQEDATIPYVWDGTSSSQWVEDAGDESMTTMKRQDARGCLP